MSECFIKVLDSLFQVISEQKGQKRTENTKINPATKVHSREAFAFTKVKIK